MEAYFAAIFEDIRHERSLILLLSLTDPDILKQARSTNDEIEIIKNLALQTLHRQRRLKQHVAMDLLEKQFSAQSISYNQKYSYMNNKYLFFCPKNDD